jgi:tetratricopeptide (TPR) repeat protein
MSRREERLWERARSYLAQGQNEAARITLESLLQHIPGSVAANLQLGGLAYAQGRLRDAARHALDAAHAVVGDAQQILQVVRPLLEVGEVVAARRCLGHPAVASCDSAPLLVQLASLRQMIGDHAQALELLDRAKALGHDGADFRYIRGVQLTFNGRLAEAEVEVESCLRMGSRYGRAAVTLARLRKQTRQSNHLPLLRAMMASVPPGSEDQGALEYAQYKELEDLADYPAAWAALRRGAAVMHALHPYDGKTEQARIDRLLALCTPDFVGAEADEHAGPQPIFIVGMPRSGTTLLERILGNHRAIAAAGELGDFARALRWAADHVTNQPLDDTLLDRAATLDFSALGRRYLEQTQWRAEDKPFFVDKLPINWIQAGFIRRALPRARILHMTRDPMDVCFSNYRAFFGGGYGYSYDLDSLAAHWRNYRRTMEHWRRVMPGRILDVSYADLVDSGEATVRRVLEFCGLDFDPACIDMQRNTTPVATLSSMQIRQSVRKHGDEWMRYARELSSLQAALHE